MRSVDSSNHGEEDNPGQRHNRNDIVPKNITEIINHDIEYIQCMLLLGYWYSMHYSVVARLPVLMHVMELLLGYQYTQYDALIT